MSVVYERKQRSPVGVGWRSLGVEWVAFSSGGENISNRAHGNKNTNKTGVGERAQKLLTVILTHSRTHG